MFYEPKKGIPFKIDPFKSLIFPRPIGWISSISKNGIANLAPYSYFNAVADEPPQVMFCSNGSSTHGKYKDSLSNILTTKEFVVNFATSTSQNQMNISSRDFKPDEDEFILSNLKKKKSRLVKAPSVKDSPVNLECKLLKIIKYHIDKKDIIIYNDIKIDVNKSIIYYDNKKYLLTEKELQIFIALINNKKFMITVGFKNKMIPVKCTNILGLDHNCGVGRHIINAANLKTGEVLNLGKQGPNIRKMYFKKRKKQRINKKKEQRIMKDIDHKISRKIINYALQHKLKIVVEDLKNIRKNKKRGNGSKEGNRIVNSWSFNRLQFFMEYKSKELGIPFIKINPQYTSQECSYCNIIGERSKSVFVCNNKHCCKYKKKRNADINAAFNVGKRSLQLGGRAQ